MDTLRSRIRTNRTGEDRDIGWISDVPVHHDRLGSPGDIRSAGNGAVHRRRQRVTAGGTWTTMLRLRHPLTRRCQSQQGRGILLRVQSPQCKCGPSSDP